MSNKRITDLTELTTPTTDDVFPVVDIATNTTTKVQLGNLPVPTSVTTALATKQDTLVSGTNIKTVNSTSLVGSGNITISATPSGVAGAIQFSDGSSISSDATKFFWDNTNKRLGIGTSSPTQSLDIDGSFRISQPSTVNAFTFSVSASTVLMSNGGQGTLSVLGINSIINAGTGQYPEYRLNNRIVLKEQDTTTMSIANGYSALQFSVGNTERARLFSTGNFIINSTTDLGARVGIKGSGSTSATTSLLVQNSLGTAALTVTDDGKTRIQQATFGNNSTYINNQSNTLWLVSVGAATSDVQILPNRQVNINTTGSYTASASALLQIDSTTQGFLPPRMTTTQKNAIATPASGLVVYDSTTNKLCCYNGSTWNDLF